jgi:hypothetical protein
MVIGGKLICLFYQQFVAEYHDFVPHLLTMRNSNVYLSSPNLKRRIDSDVADGGDGDDNTTSNNNSNINNINNTTTDHHNKNTNSDHNNNGEWVLINTHHRYKSDDIINYSTPTSLNPLITPRSLMKVQCDGIFEFFDTYRGPTGKFTQGGAKLKWEFDKSMPSELQQRITQLSPIFGENQISFFNSLTAFKK